MPEATAGFLRGLHALASAEIVRRADDQLFLARRTVEAHPGCAIAAALKRGAEEWVRQVYLAYSYPVPDDIPTISPEVAAS